MPGRRDYWKSSCGPFTHFSYDNGMQQGTGLGLFVRQFPQRVGAEMQVWRRSLRCDSTGDLVSWESLSTVDWTWDRQDPAIEPQGNLLRVLRGCARMWPN